MIRPAIKARVRPAQSFSTALFARPFTSTSAMASLKTRPLAIIAGVGEGTGAAVARRFAQHYNVALLARSQPTLDTVLAGVRARGGDGVAVAADFTDAHSVAGAFRAIRAAYPDAPVVAAVYNVGALVRKPFLALTVADYDAGHATIR